MNSEEIRMEAIKLSTSICQGASIDVVIKNAEAIMNFVNNIKTA